MGTPTDKVRLAKQEEFNLTVWFENNKQFCIISAMLISFIIFIIICFAIVGVSAVESGTLRNFINGGYL